MCLEQISVPLTQSGDVYLISCCKICSTSRTSMVWVGQSQRNLLLEDGLEVALMPKKPGRPRRRVLHRRAEAHLSALSCSDPPEGRERWSLRLRAERMVELGYADALSYETVRRTLKKTNSNLISSASG